MRSTSIMRVSREFADMMEQLRRQEQRALCRRVSMADVSEKLAANRSFTLPPEAKQGRKRR